jgi:hypothetical protein
MKVGPGDQLKNITGGASDDGQFLALQLTNADGAQMQTVMREKEISNIVAFLIEQAAKNAAKRAPERAEWKKVTTTPIAINEIGVAPGRTETEAFLTVQAGIFQMTFSTELATLLDALQNLDRMVVKRQTPAKPN